MEHLRVFQVVDGAGEEVAIHDDEVGEFAGFEGADLVFPEEQVGVVAGVELDGLLAGEGFFRMQFAVIPLGGAGDGGPHAEEGIVGIDGAEGADLLHVIGTTSRDDTGGEEAAEGLEVTEAIVAELFHEGAGIEVKPGGLDIHDDAELRGLGDGIVRHEVRVGDADAEVFDGLLLVHFFINAHEGLDGTVTYGVGGELQAVFGGALDHLQELLARDVEDAFIRGIGDAIHLALAPGLEHVGAAGEHAAIEPDLRADDAEPRILCAQGVFADLVDGGEDFIHGTDGGKRVREGEAHSEIAGIPHLLVTLE